MIEISLHQLVQASRLETPEQVRRFHELRESSFRLAQRIYSDREASYNTDHESVEEMVFGPVSLASELYKRMARMAGLLTPLRTDPLRPVDLARLIDLCIDTINYTSWQYGLLMLAGSKLDTGEETDERADSHDSPTGPLDPTE